MINIKIDCHQLKETLQMRVYHKLILVLQRGIFSLEKKVSIGRLVKEKSLRARVVWSEDEERAHSEIMKQVWRKERQT